MSIDDSKKFDPSSFLNCEKPPETKDFVMQQTMMRVKDPKVSLEFYCNILGMQLIHYLDFPQWNFTVYFVGYVDKANIPASSKERWEYCLKTPGCIELTHNYGSESEDGKIYNTGNADTTGTSDGKPVKGGFGHIGITVTDVYAACQRFKDMGVEIKKSPNSGGMKGLAFVKDPDGYLVEVLPQFDPFPTQEIDCDGVALSGGPAYEDNSKAK